MPKKLGQISLPPPPSRPVVPPPSPPPRLTPSQIREKYKQIEEDIKELQRKKAGIPHPSKESTLYQRIAHQPIVYDKPSKPADLKSLIEQVSGKKVPRGTEIELINPAPFGKFEVLKIRQKPITNVPFTEKDLVKHDSWNLRGLSQTKKEKRIKKIKEKKEELLFRGYGVRVEIDSDHIILWRTRKRYGVRLANGMSVQEETKMLKLEEKHNAMVSAFVDRSEKFLASVELKKKDLLESALKIASSLAEISEESLKLKNDAVELIKIVGTDPQDIMKIHDILNRFSNLKKFGYSYASYIRKHIVSRTKTL